MHSSPLAKIQEEPFGQLADGRKVLLYTLVNNNGQTLKVTNYGAIIVALTAANREGQYSNIALGYKDVSQYQQDSSYLGAIAGRFAGRITRGCFNLDGKNFQLDINDGEHHLHGGVNGFHRKLWQASTNENADGVSITLTTGSADGEGGYPGALTLTVVYTLTDNNQLIVKYEATTTKTTIFNPTQHLYFNLSDAGDTDILDHCLYINSTHYLPINEDSLPTGEVASVADSPFDFRESKPIGEDINSNNSQIKNGSGYDHYWLLDKSLASSSKMAAQAIEPNSGRRLSVYTDQPGLVFYSGNYLGGQPQVDSKQQQLHRSGFCLETQRPPDAPNQPHFFSAVLEAGERFSSTTVFAFDTI